MGKGSFWIKIWRIIVVYYVFYVRILFGFNGCDEYYSLKVEKCFFGMDECGNYKRGLGQFNVQNKRIKYYFDFGKL